ncbi:hypothetical protein NPIL_52731 [Nephila pilipes]|uniref:Uncharacterized protein n=1 Tax=Nephila pilipes TaxID=299642 RepID=A0A8X6UXN1_NEPPI|nr:hypothetical protein NPIL_52731 [Nephila pilipes]
MSRRNRRLAFPAPYPVKQNILGSHEGKKNFTEISPQQGSDPLNVAVLGANRNFRANKKIPEQAEIKIKD